MKKQVLILAATMLLASCGGNNSSAYTEKPGVAIAITELNAPLAKLSENFNSNTKFGVEAKAVENLDLSFRTIATPEIGLKDATYPVKSNGTATLKAGIDFTAFKASAALDSKFSASATIPTVERPDTIENLEDLKPTFVEKNINIPETSLSAKAYLDDNRGYFDLSGAKNGVKTILTEIGKVGAPVDNVVSSIDAETLKYKTPEIPAEAVDAIKALPDTISEAVGNYGQLLVSAVEAASSASYESGEFNLAQFVKAEKVDNDYRISLDASLSQIAPLALNALGDNVANIKPTLEAILKAVDAKAHASITFNEKAILSVNFSVSASAKDLKLTDLIPAEAGATIPVTDINLTADFGVGINFKYGNDVAIETLAEGDKASFQEIGGGSSSAPEEDF